MRDKAREAQLAAKEYAHKSDFSYRQLGQAEAYTIAEDELLDLIKHYQGVRIA
jgi:hypothetical protein